MKDEQDASILRQNPQTGSLERIKIDPKTTGEFIGRKDKANKKIWQHDIIYDDFEEKLGYVDYNVEDAAFVVALDENEYYYLGDIDFRDMQVVGNIFDNPNLLTAAGTK